MGGEANVGVEVTRLNEFGSQPSHKGEKLRISLWFSKESCSQPLNEI
jgi:hypothetical protein